MNRRKLSALAVSVLLATQTMAQSVRPAIPRDEALEAKVEATLKKLTLDEKIGQMLTLSIDVMGTKTYENAKVDRTKLSNELKQYGVSESRISEMMRMNEKQLLKELEPMGLEVYTPDTKIVWKLDEAKLDEAIKKYKVGNFFNAPGKALSVDEWRKIVGMIQKKAMKQLGIPTYYALDNNHGASYQQGSILFPQPINVGASFNPSIAETMARVCAYETRAADALANLLAGDANFSAKMPYTYPREINSLANYDYKVSEEVGTMEGMYNYDAKVSLLWPFGYGLSYTSYKYSNLRVDKTEFNANDQLTVSVDVTNSGARAGKEAVLLYSSDLVATSVPDNKRLRNFTKVQLQPGETKTITFKLPAKDLAFVDDDGKWRLEEGDFMLRVADLSRQVTCTATQVWDEPNI